MAGISSATTSPLIHDRPTRQMEYLKAGGYALLAVITSIAIWAMAVSVSFLGFGFVLAHYYAPAGDLSVMIQWFSSTFWSSLVTGTLVSIYPIMQIAGPILGQAKFHWDRA